MSSIENNRCKIVKQFITKYLVHAETDGKDVQEIELKSGLMTTAAIFGGIISTFCWRWSPVCHMVKTERKSCPGTWFTACTASATCAGASSRLHPNPFKVRRRISRHWRGRSEWGDLFTVSRGTIRRSIVVPFTSCGVWGGPISHRSGMWCATGREVIIFVALPFVFRLLKHIFHAFLHFVSKYWWVKLSTWYEMKVGFSPQDLNRRVNWYQVNISFFMFKPLCPIYFWTLVNFPLVLKLRLERAVSPAPGPKA